jgi:hypothetical protein
MNMRCVGTDAFTVACSSPRSSIPQTFVRAYSETKESRAERNFQLLAGEQPRETATV